MKNLPLLLLLSLTLNGCVVVDSGPSQNEKASEINVQLGLGYMQQNNLDIANQKLLKAIRLDPESTRAHNAYALLQDRLLNKEKAEKHYRLAIELDPENSESNNNYGIFLCRHNREGESEQYFLKAVENPLYKTPEFALTSAAFCLMKINELERAENYLSRAIAARSDFPDALITMAELKYKKQQYDQVDFYIKRLHRVDKPSAGSLWLGIQNAIQLDDREQVDALSEILEKDFPKSKEMEAWQAIK